MRLSPAFRQFLRSCLSHALRWSFTLLVLLVFGYAVFVAIRFHHIDTRAYAWMRQLAHAHAAAPPSGGRVLGAYAMQQGPIEVQGVRRNLSGLAFDADTQTLISVVNRPAQLVRLSLDGQVTSTHRLLNAADVEGVAYLGQGRVALLEEGRHRIVLSTLPATPDADLDLQGAVALQLSLNNSASAEGVLAGNAGFEGIGYDLKKDQLYVAKEHSPRALYRITGLGRPAPGKAMNVSIENLSDWVLDAAVVGTDLSSVEVDPSSGHLLLLSDESQTLVELDEQGLLLGRFNLSGWPGAGRAVPQAEGTAMAPNGDIFIVSEPNLFYRLAPSKVR